MAACIKPVEITVPLKDEYGNDTGQTQPVSVRCGKCIPCLQLRRVEWFFRLGQELKYSTSSHFVTLTYDDNNLYFNEYGVPSVNVRDVQLFLKRWRKLGRFRYYLVSEYGSRFGRPHYHAITFGTTEEHIERLPKVWGKGHVKVGSVSAASINYCAGYLIQLSAYPRNANKPFSLMSRRPGIGHEYLRLFGNYHKDNNVIKARDVNGNIVVLPAYYRKKLFSSLRRQAFALTAIEAYEEAYYETLNRLAVQNPHVERIDLFYKDLERENHAAILRKRVKNLKLD